MARIVVEILCLLLVLTVAASGTEKSVTYDWRTRVASLHRNGESTFLGRLGNRLEGYVLKSSKIISNKHEEFTFGKQSKPDVILEMKERRVSSNPVPPITCQQITWKVESPGAELEDCFSLGTEFWYGGAEDYSQQYWPINRQNFTGYRPYLTGAFSGSSAIMERYWLSTLGIAIVVDEAVPLFVQKNQTDICFLAQDQEPYSSKTVVQLKYDICSSTQKGTNDYLSQLHEYMVYIFLDRPTGIPDSLMMKSPIWSTWAIYKKEINDPVVKDFANQILKNNFTHSQLEIDDKWQSFYGDFTFDPNKFPNMAQTISDLNKMGFRTTLWMHPFANMDSVTFNDEVTQNFTVRNKSNKGPLLLGWWDGMGTSIDPTNPKAADWFVGKLETIRKETGIDSFKFDAGEISFLTSEFNLYNQSVTPDQYSNSYARMAARLGDMIEVRIGSRTQDLPIFVRMLDKDSNWDIENNGLKSVLTTALIMSITGYNYILPDMIGGNAYGKDFPDDELFVRWTQLTAFLPAMQFSIPPWIYTNSSIKVNQICQEMVELHEQVVYPVLLKYATQAIQIGSPIIRPMWYFDNSDPKLFTIADQFMVGNDILVAPVLDPKTYQRNIYLPSGVWQVGKDGGVIVGPKTIQYSAPIDKIPYFIFVQQ